MRKHMFTVLLTLLFASLLVCLSAQEQKSFKLLQAPEYDLDILYSSELVRLYVQVDFAIPRDQLDASSYYGVFLSSGAVFQRALVGGEYAPHFFVSNLVPEHFQPALPVAEVLNEESGVKFIGISLKDLDKFPETVTFRLWYILPVTSPASDSIGKPSFLIDGKQFWYPRNVHQVSTVKLNMLTTPRISVLIDKSFATQTDKDNSRQHTGTFLEMPDQPCSLRLSLD